MTTELLHLQVRSPDAPDLDAPDPNATEILFQTYSFAQVPIASGGFTTTSSIDVAPYSAVLVMLWARGNTGDMPIDNDIPTIDGGGIDNWTFHAIHSPNDDDPTHAGPKGFFPFLGQAGADGASGQINVNTDPGTAWQGHILVLEVTDVFVGDTPMDCVRQYRSDTKHAANYGGPGTAGGSGNDVVTWYPAWIDPTADDNHLILSIGTHADTAPANNPTVEVNESDGYAPVSGILRNALANTDAGFFSCQKLGLAIGEQPPMFNWQPDQISTGAMTYEFIPRVPDRSHRWRPVVHWSMFKNIASKDAMVTGIWPADLARDALPSVEGFLLVAFLGASQGDSLAASVASLVSDGWENLLGADVATSGGTAVEGERQAVLWKRPEAGELQPTLFDAGDHNVFALIMLHDVVATGDPINVVTTDVKETTSPNVTMPGVTTTVDECVILASSGRGSDAVHNTGGTAANKDYGIGNDAFVAEGPAQILRPGDPFNIEGSGADAGWWPNAEVTGGTTENQGGGFALLSAIQQEAGFTGDFTATLLDTAREVYVTLAIEGQPPHPLPIGAGRVSVEEEEEDGVTRHLVRFGEIVHDIYVPLSFAWMAAAYAFLATEDGEFLTTEDGTLLVT